MFALFCHCGWAPAAQVVRAPPPPSPALAYFVPADAKCLLRILESPSLQFQRTTPTPPIASSPLNWPPCFPQEYCERPAGPRPTSPASTCERSRRPPASPDTTPGSELTPGGSRAPSPAGTGSGARCPAWGQPRSPSPDTACTSTSSWRTHTTTERSTTEWVIGLCGGADAAAPECTYIMR